MGTSWRGAQVAPNVTVENFRALLTHGVNLIRYQYNAALPAESDAILGDLLDEIRVSASRCKVVLNVYSGVELKELPKLWAHLGAMYNSFDDVLVYGIQNEPQASKEEVRDVMLKCRHEIRKVSNKRISITCPFSDPYQFNDEMAIVGDDRLWYEVHMYQPSYFTHQGLYGNPTGVTYPSSVLSKHTLETALKRVIAFQEKHHARIYVGEFGVTSMADDASRAAYFKDCISIFERYGWNWTQHAWREASVWSVEGYPEAEKVIFDGWKKNG